MPHAGIQLVGMVPHSLVVTASLLHIVALLPNIFAEYIPITGSLAAKVTCYRVRANYPPPKLQSQSVSSSTSIMVATSSTKNTII